jgi:GABA(A) receptor-associated protein
MANLPSPLTLSAKELERIQTNHPDRVPIFMIRGRNIDPSFPVLQKCKYLVPKSLTLGMFSYVVRKQLVLQPEKALFLFVGNSLPTTGTLISDLYHSHKSPDGALRVTYMSESVFGG